MSRHPSSLKPDANADGHPDPGLQVHFDHCGNNGLFAGLPIFVHRAEYQAAQGPRHTVNEWLHFEGARCQLLDGPLELTPEVSIVPTPATPRATSPWPLPRQRGCT